MNIGKHLNYTISALKMRVNLFLPCFVVVAHKKPVSECRFILQKACMGK